MHCKPFAQENDPTTSVDASCNEEPAVLARQNNALSHATPDAQNRPAGSWGANKRMQEKDSATENAIRRLLQARQAEKPPVEEMAVFRKSAMASDAAAGSCTEEQLADDPVKWWQSITELKKAGRDDEARAAPALFNATHPAFEPPRSP